MCVILSGAVCFFDTLIRVFFVNLATYFVICFRSYRAINFSSMHHIGNMSLRYLAGSKNLVYFQLYFLLDRFGFWGINLYLCNEISMVMCV